MTERDCALIVLRKLGINVSYDDKQSIGKRYSRHDEVGTPYCLTIDTQTMADGTVTVRDRDTATQTRVPVDAAIAKVQAALGQA